MNQSFQELNDVHIIPGAMEVAIAAKFARYVARTGGNIRFIVRIYSDGEHLSEIIESDSGYTVARWLIDGWGDSLADVTITLL